MPPSPVRVMTMMARGGSWGCITVPFPPRRPPTRSWPTPRITRSATPNGGGANHSASQQKSGSFTQKNAKSKERQAEVMQFNELEPHGLPESDLSQIEAFDQGLTSDPGCWTQPVEFSEPERKFDTKRPTGTTPGLKGCTKRTAKSLGSTRRPVSRGAGYTGPAWWAGWDPRQRADIEGNSHG